MPLLIDARKASERLQLAQSARDNIDEAGQLSERKREVQNLEKRLAGIADRHALLTREGIITPGNIDGLTNTRQAVTAIAAAFSRERRAATLTQGQYWNNLTDRLNQAVNNAQVRHTEAWQAYWRTLFGGLPPSQLQQTIVPGLPENQTAMTRYKALHEEFDRWRSRVPGTDAELNRVRAVAQEVGEIRFIMNNDVPEPVKRFFAATVTGTGASLELLTPEVIDWLRENRMLADYVVRTR
jgi:hypothetical protein